MSLGEWLAVLVFVASIIARPFGLFTPTKGLPTFSGNSPFAMIAFPSVKTTGNTIDNKGNYKTALNPPAAVANRPSRVVMGHVYNAQKNVGLSVRGNANSTLSETAKAQPNLVKLGEAKKEAVEKSQLIK